jgi:hypothetical protein
MDEIFKISGAILASVGGAAAIIFAMSSWLGKVWANRILEKDKLAYSSELERLKISYIRTQKKKVCFFTLF